MQPCSLPAVAAGLATVSFSAVYWNTRREPVAPSVKPFQRVSPELTTYAVSSKLRESFYFQCYVKEGDAIHIEDIIHSCCQTFWRALQNTNHDEERFLSDCVFGATRESKSLDHDPITSYFLPSPLATKAGIFQPSEGDLSDGVSLIGPSPPAWSHAMWSLDRQMPILSWNDEAPIGYEHDSFIRSVVDSFHASGNRIESNLSTRGGMHRDWEHKIHTRGSSNRIEYKLHLTSDVFVNIEDAVDVLTTGYNIALSTASPVIDQEAPAFFSPQHSIKVTLEKDGLMNSTSTVIKTRTKLHFRYPAPLQEQFLQLELFPPILVGELPTAVPERAWTVTGKPGDYRFALIGSIVFSVLGGLFMLRSIKKACV